MNTSFQPAAGSTRFSGPAVDWKVPERPLETCHATGHILILNSVYSCADSSSLLGAFSGSQGYISIPLRVSDHRERTWSQSEVCFQPLGTD